MRTTASQRSEESDATFRPVIETRGLTKRYGSVTAVDDLRLSIRRGEVYGFLGPNGAGKTTTLKMLLGLVKPSAGAASVLGEEPGSPSGLGRIGALVESPAFYPYLSGRDNLRVLARYSGAPSSRVSEVLEKVGLSGRARDRFKKYSLGMKQRLGVAAALLKDPELFILDEPTNGLDPKGMAEMRELIDGLGAKGKTVVLSSHLLSEVEQVCDRVGVLRDGKLVAEGTAAGLREAGGGAGESLVVRAEPLGEAAEICGRLAGVDGVEVAGGALRLSTEPGRAAEINAKLVSAGLRVSELRPEKRSLEEAFLELTGEGTRQ